MKRKIIPIVLAAFVAIFAGAGRNSQAVSRVLRAQETRPALAASLLSSGFTYQGRLTQNGEAFSGDCDFQFSLWDAASGGAQVGATQTAGAVSVVEGLFTVQIDFGNGAFNGEARWLAVSVRCPAGGGSYTSLGPRQALTAAPYALALPGLWTQPNADSPNLIGGYSGNTLTGGVVGATIGGGGEDGPGASNRVTDSFSTVGGGWGNQAGNATGSLDDAFAATVGGGQGNVARGLGATIAGGSYNDASDGEATVGGGFFNEATAYRATVGGGATNAASNQFATVAGGGSNAASGESATVAGGFSNVASANNATVGGGGLNQATGEAATVGGGVANLAGGQFATVPGGRNNSAAGNFSFAAGRLAHANHNGSFVWADSQEYDFSTFADNGFKVRATGGVRIVVGIDETAPGPETVPTWQCTFSDGSSWTCSSSRALKENLAAVDGRQILELVAQLPVYRWNGRGQDPAITHMGPTSEDFQAAFELGDDERAIATIDLDGVALAAIQGLYGVTQEQASQIEALRTQNADLRTENADLRTEIADLETRVAALEQARHADGAAAGLPRLPGASLFVVGMLVVALALDRRRRAGDER